MHWCFSFPSRHDTTALLTVLLVIFFICGISITTGTIEYLDKAEMWSDDRNQKLISWFGTLDAAVMNLYMAMSGGRDWAEYLEVLGPIPATRHRHVEVHHSCIQGAKPAYQFLVAII
mmetsp:Transcript_87263/g.279807  ORF Transcript_87263/g.279807 Transcript_87263/m.279807 type:complete len:117 (+) Transcript_87263:134-484(+)